MADDKTQRGSPDRKRLNKSEPYEMAYARSTRASPERKALLKGESAAKGSSRSGSSTAKKAATRTVGSRGAPAGSARGRTAPSAAKRKSASPAMKRTNADPQRTRPRAATTRATPHPPKAEKTPENTAPKTMKEADAVDLLTDDHLEVGTLFKQYDKLAKKEAPAEQRRMLAATICDMLKAHTAIEEEIFYPAARRAGIEADMLDEADIEHASAKELIAQIEAGHPDDDHYDARVKVLGEYINHHVVEEHTEMFPKCRRAGMDLVALRTEMETRKATLSPDGASADDGDNSPGLLSKLTETLFSKA